MGKRVRRDSAQLNLRLEPEDRERVRAAIPRGSFNAVAVQLLMDYVQLIETRCQPVPGETRRSHTELPREDSAA